MGHESHKLDVPLLCADRQQPVIYTNWGQYTKINVVSLDRLVWRGSRQQSHCETIAPTFLSWVDHDESESVSHVTQDHCFSDDSCVSSGTAEYCTVRELSLVKLKATAIRQTKLCLNRSTVEEDSYEGTVPLSLTVSALNSKAAATQSTYRSLCFHDSCNKKNPSCFSHRRPLLA